MTKKIVFLDIDGTIRWFDGRVPDSTVYAIREARKNGHEICICSGRPFSLIEKNIMEIGFDGVVSCAGTYVLYKDQCVRSVSFEKETVHRLCEYLVENHCLIELQRYDRTFLPADLVEKYDAMNRELMEDMGKDAKPLEEYPGIVKDYTEVDHVEKVMFFSDDLSYEDVYEKWEGIVHMTPFSIPSSQKSAGEVSPVNVNKTEGIRSILEHCTFTPADVIAIGDGDNDVDMLEFASVGIAMGNATEKARAAADWQTAAVLEDGILHAFKKLGLIL